MSGCSRTSRRVATGASRTARRWRSSRRRLRATAAPRTASAWPAGSTRCGSRCSRAGLEPGDEVIVPANTFIATFEAVSQAGGAPVRSTSGSRTTTSTRLRPRRRDGAHAIRSCPCTSTGSWRTCGRSRARRAHGLPISRTRARRTAPSATASAPARRGAGGRVQLLSGQEPRRLRRRRRARRRTTPQLAARVARAARARAAREVRARARSAIRRGSTRSRRSCCSHKLPLLDGWNDERRDGGRASTPSALEGVGDLRLPPVAAGERAGLAPVLDPDGRPGAPRALPAEPRDRDRPALPGAGAPVGGVPAPRLPAGSVPGRRGDRTRGAVAADLPGDARGAARGGRRRRSQAYFRNGA